jgi:hypothetical protein
VIWTPKTLFFILALVLTVSACKEDVTPQQEIRKTVDEANIDLNEMDKVRKELQAEEIYLDRFYKVGVIKVENFQEEKKCEELIAILERYLALGNNVLRADDKPGVRLGNKKSLEKFMDNAKYAKNQLRKRRDFIQSYKINSDSEQGKFESILVNIENNSDLKIDPKNEKPFIAESFDATAVEKGLNLYFSLVEENAIDLDYVKEEQKIIVDHLVKIKDNTAVVALYLIELSSDSLFPDKIQKELKSVKEKTLKDKEQSETSDDRGALTKSKAVLERGLAITKAKKQRLVELVNYLTENDAAKVRSELLYSPSRASLLSEYLKDQSTIDEEIESLEEALEYVSSQIENLPQDELGVDIAQDLK